MAILGKDIEKYINPDSDYGVHGQTSFYAEPVHPIQGTAAEVPPYSYLGSVAWAYKHDCEHVCKKQEIALLSKNFTVL